jgi:hypothetical protein
MRKKTALFCILASLIVLVTNCIQVTTKVIVDKDGSGTIEYTYIISNNFVDFLNQMSNSETEGPKVDYVDQLIADGLPQKSASTFGDGVTFVSYEKISTDVGKGFKGIYSFPDISKVSLNQNPMNPEAKEGDTQALKEYFRFQFKPGNPAVLVIIQPKKEFTEKKDSDSRENMEISDDMLEMMRNLYKDMKISIQVAVKGKIMTTNAVYVDNNTSTLTLLEIDFGKLTADADEFKALMKKNPESIGEFKELIKNVPGIKLELEEKLNVKFK